MVLQKRAEKYSYSEYNQYILVGTSRYLKDVIVKFKVKDEDKLKTMSLDEFFEGEFSKYLIEEVYLYGISYPKKELLNDLDSLKRIEHYHIYCHYEEETFFIEEYCKVEELKIISKSLAHIELFENIDNSLKPA